MTLQLSKVHEYKRLKDGSQAVLERVNPICRLRRGDDVPIFIQNGVFYMEGGAEFKKHELPAWLDEEIAKMSPAARTEVGIQDWKPPAQEAEETD